MGFVITGSVLSRQPSPRLFKEAVGRILTSCGIPDPLTVESPGKHTLIAMAAVNDALETIWVGAPWEFRKKQVYLIAEDAVPYYDLPGDYHMFAREGLANANRECGIPYQRYEALLTAAPWLAFMPGLATQNLSHSGAVLTAFIDAGGLGIPDRWSIFREKLMLFPGPSSAAYTEKGLDFDDDKNYLFTYYTSFRTLSLDTDEVPLPPALLPALHFMALAYLKQALEYPDFSADENRGERLLSIERAKAKRAVECEWDGFTPRPEWM